MTAELLRWLLTGLITILVIVNWFWIKRWVNQQDETKLEWTRAGGVVTREMYFSWCHEQQAKCYACSAYRTLTDWRNGMLDKGGVVTKTEQKEITKEITEAFCERLNEMFIHHREWVGQELKLLRMEIIKNNSQNNSQKV